MIWPAKYYTYIIGAAFLVIVGFTLVTDTYQYGLSLESVHKATHIIIGLWAVGVVMSVDRRQYIAFALFNAAFYGILATIGWAIPDFLGLTAFGTADAALHTMVAVLGLVSGIAGLRKDE